MKKQDKLELITKYKFYFLHATTLANLKLILKSDKIKLGDDVSIKEHQFSSGLNVIYLSMYFDLLQNIQQSYPISLIINPKLLFDYIVHFNKGWGYQQDFVIINKKDKMINNKMNIIINYLKNPDIPDKLKGIGIKEHEIFIEKSIPLEKYLIGIICNCDNETFNKIKYMVKKSKYNNIQIFKQNIVPKFDDIFTF